LYSMASVVLFIRRRRWWDWFVLVAFMPVLFGPAALVLVSFGLVLFVPARAPSGSDDPESGIIRPGADGAINLTPSGWIESAKSRGNPTEVGWIDTESLSCTQFDIVS